MAAVQQPDDSGEGRTADPDAGLEVLGLVEALRSTGAVREFQDRPVSSSVLSRVFDTARFAPSGGNQQAWHVVLVEDPVRRRAMRDLYVDGWSRYLAMRAARVQPWAPIGDRDVEAAAIAVCADVEAGRLRGSLRPGPRDGRRAR